MSVCLQVGELVDDDILDEFTGHPGEHQRVGNSPPYIVAYEVYYIKIKSF